MSRVPARRWRLLGDLPSFAERFFVEAAFAAVPRALPDAGFRVDAGLRPAAA